LYERNRTERGRDVDVVDPAPVHRSETHRRPAFETRERRHAVSHLDRRIETVARRDVGSRSARMLPQAAEHARAVLVEQREPLAIATTNREQ